jgi:hypothetical protein
MYKICYDLHDVTESALYFLDFQTGEHIYYIIVLINIQWSMSQRLQQPDICEVVMTMVSQLQIHRSLLPSSMGTTTNTERSLLLRYAYQRVLPYIKESTYIIAVQLVTVLPLGIQETFFKLSIVR